MDLMLNELSVEGQFYDNTTLSEAIGKIIGMRNAAKRYGVEVYCHANTANRHVRPDTALIHALSRDQRMYMTSWLTRQGPFWEDARRHAPNEWYECDGEIVTDTGLAEAAHCVEIGIDRRMVSFAPSSWERSPIVVIRRENNAATDDVQLANYWNVSNLEEALTESDPEPESWEQLEQICRRRFASLNFAANSFHPLNGQPFAPGVAPKIRRLLNALNEFWAVDGLKSDEGRRIYDNHFTGGNAWFSDSSDTEKHQFRRELTFPSPNPGEDAVFCPWHGKLRMAHRQQFRIHFTWPIQPGEQLHVVYLGLKITRQ